MNIWEVVDNVATVNGDDLVLSQLGGEWAMHTGPTLLMSSAKHHSEDELARLAFARVATATRVLIGGLGMGFTLRSALNLLPSDAQIVVAETSSALVRWNRTYVAHLARAPLSDPRVRFQLGDVGDRIAAATSE